MTLNAPATTPPSPDRRVAIVTTSKGLGRAVVRELARTGCNVVTAYNRDLAAAEACVVEARALGVQALLVRADVTSEKDRRALVHTAEDLFHRVDILVNCVGPFTRERRDFADYAAEAIRGVIDGNLVSALLLDSAVLPIMRRQRGGRIIHFGFGRALEAPAWPHRAVYAAAKTGLMNFTKSLAAEEAANRITVNMVCPGEIKGMAKEQLVRDVAQSEDPENRGMRPGVGEDVARLVAFLCAPESDYLSGLVVDVAGGLDPIRALKAVRTS